MDHEREGVAVSEVVLACVEMRFCHICMSCGFVGVWFLGL